MHSPAMTMWFYRCHRYRLHELQLEAIQLGLKFDYGELDLDFDNEEGNLTRLEQIIDLIQSLRYWSAQDLYEMTLESTLHNHDLVTSQKFWDVCEQSNTHVYKILKGLA